MAGDEYFIADCRLFEVGNWDDATLCGASSETR